MYVMHFEHYFLTSDLCRQIFSTVQSSCYFYRFFSSNIVTFAMPRFLKTKNDTSAKSGLSTDVPTIVKGVIDDIRGNGDAAVSKYSEKFDSWSRPSFRLSQDEIDAAIAACPEQTIKDIQEVQSNVRKFAEAQRASLREFEIEMEPGVFLGQRNCPVQNVGWSVCST